MNAMEWIGEATSRVSPSCWHELAGEGVFRDSEERAMVGLSKGQVLDVWAERGDMS